MKVFIKKLNLYSNSHTIFEDIHSLPTTRGNPTIYYFFGSHIGYTRTTRLINLYYYICDKEITPLPRVQIKKKKKKSSNFYVYVF